ncbi:hypothetical protein ART_1262 [Arthrobacter sp. PAMC 25486]|nr:hypothetical protein ART_1262 [Arthrobacter sp. PAMC 25486]
MDKNGVVYTLQAPQVATDSPKLLVVFSSIHETMYTASLMRYFTQNFASIQKYVAPETIVLRIADVGGIIGSFYLNNKYDPNNANSIQSLISSIVAKYSIKHESVVLYGGSKGATGALYHGLVGQYGVVAVEPIVNDEHYYATYDDLHFTKNTCFDRKKETEFLSVIDAFRKRVEPCDRTRIAIVYSQRSPQRTYIEKHAIVPLAQYIRVYNSEHPNIKDHPDVARNAIPITLASINTLLYNLSLDVGSQTII